ncbi:MAG: helical backbone metal receptor, partial [Gammaproteobacteria bacterium]|nr:helical backbone metal receptor [Gammaproteobacteria bacterium]
MASSQLKAEPISIIDDAGNTITLSGPVHRVISLAPALTEIIYHVGGGNRLVGTVEHSDYPAAARNIQRIGAHDRFDFETILALQPDLILAWASGNPANQLSRLEKLGLLVYRAEPGTLESLASTIQQIGKVVGNAHEGVARSLGRVITANGLKQEFSHRQNLTVVDQVWHEPIITLN